MKWNYRTKMGANATGRGREHLLPCIVILLHVHCVLKLDNGTSPYSDTRYFYSLLVAEEYWSKRRASSSTPNNDIIVVIIVQVANPFLVCISFLHYSEDISIRFLRAFNNWIKGPATFSTPNAKMSLKLLSRRYAFFEIVVNEARLFLSFINFLHTWTQKCNLD